MDRGDDACAIQEISRPTGKICYRSRRPDSAHVKLRIPVMNGCGDNGVRMLEVA